ncbi:MAG: hypothetical protein Q8N97_05285 [Methanobacteriaceae archaeon]|nr:hypothetical protein [Methanobacteriaceae archaeon]
MGINCQMLIEDNRTSIEESFYIHRFWGGDPSTFLIELLHALLKMEFKHNEQGMNSLTLLNHLLGSFKSTYSKPGDIIYSVISYMNPENDYFYLITENDLTVFTVSPNTEEVSTAFKDFNLIKIGYISSSRYLEIFNLLNEEQNHFEGIDFNYFEFI